MPTLAIAPNAETTRLIAAMDEALETYLAAREALQNHAEQGQPGNPARVALMSSDEYAVDTILEETEDDDLGD